MDALIRAARMAPSRARLSDVRQPSVSGQAAPLLMDPLVTLRESLANEIRAELTAELQSQIQHERERASDEGYAEGLARGREAALAEAESVREYMQGRVRDVTAALEQAHSAALESLADSVGEIAFAAVCRLVSEQASTRSFVLQLVRNTCAELRADSIAGLRLHPRDIELLRELADRDELRIDALALTLIADESLQLGGCIVEASSGRYDGALENQLRRLHAVLSDPTLRRGEE